MRHGVNDCQKHHKRGHCPSLRVNTVCQKRDTEHAETDVPRVSFVTIFIFVGFPFEMNHRVEFLIDKSCYSTRFQLVLQALFWNEIPFQTIQGVKCYTSFIDFTKKSETILSYWSGGECLN